MTLNSRHIVAVRSGSLKSLGESWGHWCREQLWCLVASLMNVGRRAEAQAGRLRMSAIWLWEEGLGKADGFCQAEGWWFRT